MDTKSPVPETTTVVSPNQSVVSSIESKSENQVAEEGVKKSTPRLTWTNETEALLQGWADISSCFKWMHENSFRKYSKVNNYFAIPIIILSTVSGTLNVSLQGYVPAQYLNVAQAGIGGLGIFTGILTTLQNLFKYAQLSESHNNVSIGWSKLNRNIQIELSVERSSRKDADSFIKICISEYDRLIEQSPTIPLDIIDAFKKMFREQNEKKKQEKLLKLRERENLKKQISKGKSNQDIIKVLDEIDEDELMLPDICDSINHTKVYKHVINDKIFIETTQGEKVDLTTKSNEVEDEIKNTFRDKINELEKKTSGVAQFKLAMIGERLAPLHHQNNILSHHKDLDNFKDKLDLNKNKFTKIAQSDNFKNIINSVSTSSKTGNNSRNLQENINRDTSGSRPSSNSISNTKERKSFISSTENENQSLIINSSKSNPKDEIEKLSLKGFVKNISNIFSKSRNNSLSDSETGNGNHVKNEIISDTNTKKESSSETELTDIVIIPSVAGTGDPVEINDTLNDGSTPKISPRSLTSQSSDRLSVTEEFASDSDSRIEPQLENISSFTSYEQNSTDEKYN
jgi:hypothetical protein